MPVKLKFRQRFWQQSWPNFAHGLAICVLAAAAVWMLDGAVHALMAQTPFGGPRPSAAEPQVGGIVGWLLSKQSEFYREMSSTIRAVRSDGHAVWTLLGISFAYGIFMPPVPDTARR